MTRISLRNIDLENIPIILDGCCGTAGFLIETMAYMTGRIRNDSRYNERDRIKKIEHICNDCLFGIEANKRTSRIARINMYLHGDGGSHIFHGDGLEESPKPTIDMTDEEQSETIDHAETVKNEHEPIKLKIGTVGNFILAALAILIVGTGALTYYLIHTAKEDYDKQYSEIVANISNIVNETEDENVIPIGNLIDSAISDVTGQSSNTVTTDASNTRKTLNEELVVLYNGLILDTTKMDEVTLQYIDSTNKDADKYVITYYNYENY